MKANIIKIIGWILMLAVIITPAIYEYGFIGGLIRIAIIVVLVIVGVIGAALACYDKQWVPKTKKKEDDSKV